MWSGPWRHCPRGAERDEPNVVPAGGHDRDGQRRDDPELADLFAFLLESNEARQAVARGDDLRETIMRPIDTDEIESLDADAAESAGENEVDF